MLNKIPEFSIRMFFMNLAYACTAIYSVESSGYE